MTETTRVRVGVYRIDPDDDTEPQATEFHRLRSAALHDALDEGAGWNVHGWGDTDTPEPHEWVELLVYLTSDPTVKAAAVASLGFIGEKVAESALEAGVVEPFKELIHRLVGKQKRGDIRDFDVVLPNETRVHVEPGERDSRITLHPNEGESESVDYDAIVGESGSDDGQRRAGIEAKRQDARTPRERDAEVIDFRLPANPTPEEEKLAAQIRSLDHRSNLALKGPKQHEVERLLEDAAASLESGLAVSGVDLAKRAEAAYRAHLQQRNRLEYLGGMLLGAGASSLIAIAAPYLGVLPPPYPLHALVFFAVLGSAASVMSRLQTIDLKTYITTPMLVTSGAVKPIVATIFALVVALLIQLDVVFLELGDDPPVPPRADLVPLIAAFFCGFSERFASDIFSRVAPPSRDETDDGN